MRYLLLYFLLLIATTSFSQFREGQDRALFFAVNDYDKMQDLSMPIQEVEAIATALEENFGFVTEIVRNPDFETIEQKIDSYEKEYANGQYAKQGQLLIFFSGHGLLKGKNGYFMPKDGDPNRPYALGLEYDYWRYKINEINCQHILVVIDAPQSGSFDPNWRNRPHQNFSRPGERFSDQLLLNHSKYWARIFITSGAQVVRSGAASSFAQQLRNGFNAKETPSDFLTSSQLFATYFSRAVPAPIGGTFGDDDPGSTFIFFKQTKNGIEAKALERDAWQEALGQNSVRAYQQFLIRYPKGKAAPLAQQRLDQLLAEQQELADWRKANQVYTVEAFRNFMEDYPNSAYKELASRLIREDMVLVKGGTFQMGNEGEKHAPPHMVRVQDFYIARHEATFDEFDAFCIATGRIMLPGKGPRRGQHPVVNVSWFDAIEYCNWRSNKEGLNPVYTLTPKKRHYQSSEKGDKVKWWVSADWTANGYRLPTEAEWEFAARNRGQADTWAGTSEESQLSLYANFCGQECDERSDYVKLYHDGYSKASPIGTYQANGLGLFDMSGNVREWCWDWYDENYYIRSPQENPKGPAYGSYKVTRSGSWYGRPEYLRCAYRYYLRAPAYREHYIGFRICRSAN